MTVRPEVLRSPEPAAPQVSGRFVCFDGLRAVAAVAIVLHHVSSNVGTNTSSGAGALFARMDGAVPVFFLLSGFLLYRPFAVAHLDGTHPPDWKRYLRRRAVRIFPAYWLLLAVSIVIGVVSIPDLRHLVAYAGLLHIYGRDLVLAPLWQTWSLATEVSFYVFLPVFAALMGAVVRRSRSRYRVELAGVALLWLAGWIIHVAVLLTHSASTPATLWLPSQIDLFAVGMLLAVLSAGGRVPRVCTFAGDHPALCWLGAAFVLWVSATQLGLPRVFGDLTDRQEIVRTVCYSVIALLLTLPAVFGPQDLGLVRALLRSRVAQAVGVVSYGVFLWHVTYIVKLRDWGALDWLPTLRFVSVLCMVLALTLATAALSWFGLEKRLLRRRERPLAASGLAH